MASGTKIFVLGIEGDSRLPDVPGFRNERGQYTSAQSAQIQRNRLFSEFLREQVGRRMKNHISFGGRASASTGRLLRATLDDKNVVVTKEFVGVGVPDWLDRSQAKYWRTFEEGSAAVWSHAFVGTRLFSVGRSPFPVAHGQSPGLRSLGDGEAGGAGGRQRGAIFVVKHEIKPANIYAQVGQAELGTMKSFGVYSARKFFAEVFGDQNLIIRGSGGGNAASGIRFS